MFSSSSLLYRLFGALLVISFIEFSFIMKQFKFLKTIIGKGMFNLFLASMFLVGSDDGLWNYLMVGSLATCGLFFMLVGCACINNYEDKDLKKSDVKESFSEKKESESALLTAPDKSV